ncbi:MAG: acyl-CoA thioesterase [Brevinema sp.]
MRSDFNFFCPIRVRYGEVDQQGIVYNVHYLVYTDIAYEEFLRSKGYTNKILIDEYNGDICHRKSTIEYLASAFEDDMLEVGVRVANVGNKSFTLVFEIFRQGEDIVLFSAEMLYVGYDPQNRCSRPLTDIMRKILSS